MGKTHDEADPDAGSVTAPGRPARPPSSPRSPCAWSLSCLLPSDCIRLSSFLLSRGAV